MNSTIKKPNLFIVGEPKCGTTTLYELLKQHPDVFMAEEKEPSYFSKDLIEESIQFHGKNLFFHHTTLDSYLSLFAKATNQKIIGEATTRYMYSKSAAHEIHNFNPKAKIIIMLREPIEFMYSLHSQHLSVPSEDEPDFIKALELEESRKEGHNIPKIAKHPSLLYYRSRAKFYEHIERFLEYFDKNQVFVIILEDFRNNSESIFKKLLEFLEIDPEFKPSYRIANKNTKPIFPFLYRKIHNPKLKMFLYRILPNKLFARLRAFSTKILEKEEGRKPLSNDVKISLMREFKDDVESLNYYLNKENLVQLDLLKLWGYKNIH